MNDLRGNDLQDDREADLGRGPGGRFRIADETSRCGWDPIGVQDIQYLEL